MDPRVVVDHQEAVFEVVGDVVNRGSTIGAVGHVCAVDHQGE